MTHYGRDMGAWRNRSPDALKLLLNEARTIAVVGLSPKAERPSYQVAEYLKQNNYKIIPVRPGVEDILGETAYPDLKSIPVAVDIVDVFRKPQAAFDITEAAIEIGAQAVWLQEGVVSPEAFVRGEEAGLLMVMDRCIKQEHIALMDGRLWTNTILSSCFFSWPFG